MATQATKTAIHAPATHETPEPASLHEQISALAYSLWHARGCPDGSSEDDWFNAEAQLKEESNVEV